MIKIYIKRLERNFSSPEFFKSLPSLPRHYCRFADSKSVADFSRAVETWLVKNTSK
jgi:hypothetical protein